MTPSPWNWLILLAVLLVPFQLVGITVYFTSRKANSEAARTRGLFVPAGLFFAVFFLLFLWSYFNPGMMFMVSGAVNLFILVLIVVGSFLNLVVSALVMAFLNRKKPAEDGAPPSAS